LPGLWKNNISLIFFGIKLTSRLPQVFVWDYFLILRIVLKRLLGLFQIEKCAAPLPGFMS
jgi:hypothetical protein